MITLIAGVVSLDGSTPDSARVSAMLDAMNPRGLDDLREIKISGAAVFGAVSLAAGGPGRALPPRILTIGPEICIADAVIWDREGMAAAGEISDSCWAARVFTERGGAGLAALHGDFAVARWTGKRLELARDHFGARPLQFTAQSGKWLAFASLPAALLRTGLASRKLDAESLLHYVAKDSPRPGRSYYADIFTARPAHLTTINPDANISAIRYWRVPVGPKLSFAADPNLIFAQMRKLLEQAVRRRVPQEGSVAGHVSGGIDSTPIGTLAAQAIRVQGRRFLAYSFAESQEDYDFDLVDEAPYAVEAVIAEPNIDHVPIFDQGEFKTKLDGFDLDIFESASDLLPERQVLADAAGKGAETLLSGWGGDQMASFHPIGYLAEMFVAGRWLRCLRELRRLRRTRLSHGLRASYAGLIYHMIFLMLLPGKWRRAATRLTGRGLHEPNSRPRFVPAHRRAVELESEAELPAHFRTFEWRRSNAERWFIAYRLELFAQLSAPYGIRYAYPLLDLDLVRFVMCLPGWFLAHEGGFRTLLREAITDLVPERVRQRTVKLFPFPLEAVRMAEQLERLDARLEAVEAARTATDVIDVAALRRALSADMISPDAMWRIVREHAARGEQYFLPAYRYLSAVHMAIALEQHDRESAISPAIEDT